MIVLGALMMVPVEGKWPMPGRAQSKLFGEVLKIHESGLSRRRRGGGLPVYIARVRHVGFLQVSAVTAYTLSHCRSATKTHLADLASRVKAT